jgi:putative phosphoribosyl transferase
MAQIHSEAISIPAGQDDMQGMLTLPDECIGVVVCAHDDGLRAKPSNDYVASALRDARLGTLYLELPADGGIDPLADRLQAACEWLGGCERTADLAIGLYGSSCCAAAVLQHAALRGTGIAAIVSRSGRTELAGQAVLGRIEVPTLLIVGGLDDGAVRSNRTAYAALRCEKRIEIVPGADHAFEEPGNCEVVARLARNWFLRHAHA